MKGKEILKGVVMGALFGAGMGLVIGLAIVGCQDIVAFVTCSTYNPQIAINIGVTCIPICTIIGLIFGISGEKEKKREEEETKRLIAQEKAEEERQQKARQLKCAVEEGNKKFAGWSRQLAAYYQQIEKKECSTTPEAVYTSIERMTAGLDVKEKRYQDESVRLQVEHITRMKKRILESARVEILEDGTKIRKGGLDESVYACRCVVMAETMAKGMSFFKPLLTVLEQLKEESENVIFYLRFDSYGIGKLPLDNLEVMEQVEKNISELERKLNREGEYIQSFGKNVKNNFAPSELNKDYIRECAVMMWYYAKKKPFNMERFALAQKLFGAFTSVAYVEKQKEICVTKVEDVLARIYAKNQIGGIGTARQETDYIKFWLKRKIDWKCYDECYTLASGLAWMELYELELEVLRKLVEEKVQLPEDIQERLSFLESGATANVKIYDVDETTNFCFDNSALEWGSKEYGTFFRMVNMKKMWPKYSLAVNKWTKTLPLLKGQKVSFERIYDELSELVKDFDGEIVCERVKAKAIDLTNVVYEEAVKFQFVTERNRCVSVLFSGEKYGRNLNLIIYTMFTPDRTLSLDSLEKYCLAIKSNTYVESFRESILQTIDEVLKIHESVYEEQMGSEKKNLFDEEWE